MVMSFAKTDSEWHDALESFERFVLGIEGSLKGSENSLVFDHEVPLAGSAGRQYHLTIGRYSGVARLIEKNNWFYVVAVIGAEATSAEADHFFSSFTPGPVNAESSNVTVNVEAYLATESVSKSGDELPPEPWPHPLRPISGGVLNGKAVSLFRPEYPEEARQAGDRGEVRIFVVIDEQGKVIAAKAIAGPKSLQAVAIAAAWKSRFSPTRLSGQPVKISGVIEYKFTH
jgi:TonB family protein